MFSSPPPAKHVPGLPAAEAKQQEQEAQHSREQGTTINKSETKVSTSMERQDMSAITVSSRIPEFWTHMPRLWFVQLEGIIRPQKLGDAAKADLIITKLNCEALQQVSDILFSPPEDNKYDALKERLLKVYEESADRQFQKLVSEMELGSQKPSFLLRRMRDLGRNTQVSEKTLHSLWLARLPSNVRAVLTVSQDQDLENLANMADKIMETMRPGEIAEVSGPSSRQQFPITDLLTQMNKMSTEIAALREEVKEQRQQQQNNAFRGRGRGRGFRSRSRSSSRPRMTPEDPNWLCKHHFRYRGNARSCEQPCSWKTGN